MYKPINPAKFEIIDSVLSYDDYIHMFIWDLKYYYVDGWWCDEIKGGKKLFQPTKLEKKEMDEWLKQWEQKKQQEIQGGKDEK